ncbi:MAG: TIGR02301 family protein [Pseudomonadota bacterium]
MTIKLSRRAKQPRTRQLCTRPHVRGRAKGVALVVLLTLILPHHAIGETRKPYDQDLLRISEILGAIHYLRELCGSNDGQLWRDQMNELLQAEGSSALRRARLTRRFNQGYRSYSRTYNACTSSAQTAVERFMSEGLALTQEVLKRVP